MNRYYFSQFSRRVPRIRALCRSWGTRACSRLTLTVILSVATLLVLLALLGQAAWPVHAVTYFRYVAPGSAGGVDSGDCSNSSAPCATVQYAVNLAAPGDEIRVAQGTYTDIHVIGPFTQTVYLTKSLTLRGGYTTTQWATNFPITQATVLDARGLGRVIYIDTGATASIDGFHIVNGSISGDGGGVYLADGNSVIQNCGVYSNAATGNGGGIYVANGNPVVQDNKIFFNTASGSDGGGGIYVYKGFGTIRGNLISTNTAQSGGGVFIDQASTTLQENAIFSNTAGSGTYGGGGIMIWNANGAQVLHNTIAHNMAMVGNGYGGGIYVQFSAGTIQNNLIYSNTATGLGGGIFYWQASAGIESNTIYGNTGEGIYFTVLESPSVHNNIVVSNTGGGIQRGHLGDSTVGGVDYNDVSGNGAGDYVRVAGTGNISDTPQFVNPGVDFHLRATSPARDAADPNNFPGDDLEGRARPFGSRADMGALEYYEGTCFARLNSGQVFTTVQAAVDAITVTTPVTVQVAGVCTDVHPITEGGQTFTQTVYLTKSLTLRGGYSPTYWAAPITSTILDAQGKGRVIYITGTSAITVDGLIIRSGNATGAGGQIVGGGIYARAVSPTIQNVIFYSNTATWGGGFASESGSNPKLLNNTFVTNTATSGSGGGGIALYSTAIVSNTIVVSNSGGGLWVQSSISPSLAYNDVWNNNGGDYINVAAGPNSLAVDPRFVNFAGRDFHLRYDSPLVHAADPNTMLNMDLEGDIRPLGRWIDIGADEAATYPNVDVSSVSGAGHGTLNQIITYTHYITNSGTVISDTYDLSHTVNVNPPSSSWLVNYASPISLMRGESKAVLVTVTVGSGYSGTEGIVNLIARSRISPDNAYGVGSDQTVINWKPGVSFTPLTTTQYINPGTVISVAHTLQNTGNDTDTFRLDWSWTRNWPSRISVELIPTATQYITLGQYATATIWVTMAVSDTAPGGLGETVLVTATRIISPYLQSVLTDTLQVNFTPGPRYVAAGGADNLNNCHVSGSPCGTIRHAVDQATNGDTVQVAKGTYFEHDFTLNKSITLRGGYTIYNWSDFRPSDNPTIIDAQGQGRVLNIFGDPTVEGFTLQNGRTDGSGGGVYISLGAPALRQNVIISNTAGLYGGGVFNDNVFGAPILERNLLAFNTAEWGGGFATNANPPIFWNNLVYGNKANSAGGGVYVGGGSPVIWHDTIFSNTASTAGGGFYLAGDSPVVSNTLVVSNTALVAGGVYSQTGLVVLAYNDVWGNVAGNYVGLSGGLNSLSADPLFVNPAGYDLRLQGGSPVIGKGDYGPVHEDYWGNPRPVDAPEIGADEYVLARMELIPNHANYVLPGQMLTYTHNLTNTGNYTDSFSLVAKSPHNWAVIATPLVSVTLGVSMTTPVTVTIWVPPDAISSTVDTIVVTATSWNESSAWTTAVNTLTVGRIVSVSLESDMAALGYQGKTTVYSHVVTNTGNYTDTFTFNARNSHGWPITPSLSSITLAGYTTATLLVSVQVPSSVPTSPVIVDTTVVTATSLANPAMWDRVADTTYVNRNLGVKFTPNRSGSSRPGSIVYSHTITNTGNYTETFNLTYLSSQNWTVSFPPTVTLASGQARPVSVTVNIPGGTISGTVDVSVITATSPLSVTVFATVVDTTTVKPAPAVSLDNYYPVAVGWCIDADDAGWLPWLPYWFMLQNTSNLTDTYDLTASSQHGWAAQVIPASDLLNPGTYDIVEAQFQVPTGPSEPYDDVVVVTATSRADNTVWDTASYVTAYNYQIDVDLTPDESGTVGLENSIVYHHVLTNLSITTTENVDLVAGNTQGWGVSVDPPSVIGLGPGASTPITVTVYIPPDAVDVVNTTFVTATTTIRCLAWDRVTDVTTVARPDVTLYPDHNSSVVPGTVINYAHILSNTGVVTDSYVITYSDPLGWGTSFTPTAVYTLSPGSFVSVTVTVNVPLTGTQSLSGTINTPVITATSTNYPTIFDTAVDTTTVAYVPEAVIAPNGSQHAYPSGVVTYTHALTNTGNYTQSFDLTTHPSFGFAVITPTEVGPLAPGEVLTGVQVVVYIPDHAAVGATEETQVIATFGGRYQTVAVDLTTIDSLPGPRYVAPNGTDQNNNCQLTTGIGPCATIQYAVNQASPGDTINVAQGTYTEMLILDKPSLSLQGGYAVTDWTMPHPYTQPTILDAQNLGRAISITAPIMSVSGFRITNGNAGNQDGGAIYIGTSQPITLAANVIYNNTATNGGAIYARDANVSLQNSVLYSNTANWGGGMYLSGTATLVNDTLIANQAVTSTGVGGLGGALYQAGGSLWVTSTILVSNTAVISNGVVYTEPSAIASVFAYNDLWGNTDAGNVTSTNSLWVDPLFRDAAAGDFRLSPDSACIDNGAAVPLTTDLAGALRPQAVVFDRPHISNYDMGAFELPAIQSLQLNPASVTQRTTSSSVYYQHTLTNLGSYTDTVGLTATIDLAPSGWLVIISPSPVVTLASNMSTTVWVTVSVPGTPAIGTMATALITATSRNAAVISTATDVDIYQNEADLAIRKSAAPAGWLGPGYPVTYTLVYTNYGPADAAGIVITDILPITVANNVTFTSSGLAITPTVGYTHVWRVQPMPMGRVGMITVTGVVSSSPGIVEWITNTASIQTTQNDVTPTNNLAWAASHIDRQPPSTPGLLSPASGMLTTTRNITFRWQPSNDSSGSGLSRYQIAITGMVYYTSPIFYTGYFTSAVVSSPTTAFTLTSMAYGVYTWTVSAFDNVGNVSSAPLRVLTVDVPHLNVTKRITPTSPVAGVPFTYVLTISNTGPVTATGVLVSDTLPANTYYVSGGSRSGNDVTWVVPSISPLNGAVQTTFVVSACQTVTNTFYRVMTSTEGVSTTLGAAVQTAFAAPTINAAFTQSASIVQVYQPVYFTDTTTTNGGAITAWSWNLGSIKTGRTVSQTYTSSGTYTAVLTVTDTCGFAQATSHTVTVMPAAFARLSLGAVTTRTAGVGFTLVVTASDQYGNVVPNFNGVISLTDSTKTLMPATWSVWSSGVATPFITITRALANDRITATVSATPTIWITSNLFAVLPNVPASIALQVNPVAIPRGGTAQLTATVQDAYTNPVANGTPVVFTTTAGLLPSQQLTYTAATASGVARAVLTSTCTVQAVTLSAQAGTAVTQTNANFAAPGVAAFVTLTLQSQVLPVGGTTTVLSTTVRDCANSPVTNTTSVAFQVAPISAAIAPNPALTLGGTATATLTSPTVAGSSIITASSGSVRNSQLITFTPLSPYTVTVSPSRSVITPTESTNVNVQVTDRYGNAVANGTPVTFTWTLGTLWPSVVSTSNGWASTVFTANGTEGSAVITATAGLGAHGVTTITVSLGRTLIYLPLVLRDYRSGKNLVVSAINSSTNPANVSVVVRNTGDVAVTEAFWVILYLDPTSQVQINKFWWDVGCPLVGGAAWQVTTPVAPGQSMTLLPANATPPYQGYWPASFSAGQHRLWAQVDAYATSGTTGLVQETNESDNIAGPVTFNVP